MLDGGPVTRGGKGSPVPSHQAPAADLTFFVRGELRNPLNGTHGHWHTRYQYAKAWRERTAMFFLFVRPDEWWQRHPTIPKRVTMTAHVWNLWDDDAIPAGMKNVRDALVPLGIIHSDGPESGHEFVYCQRRDRKLRGVEVRVEVRR